MSSPASRPKSKKPGKDSQKATLKPSAATAAGTAVPPGAYYNGRFRSIDETDEHAVGSLGSAADYDSVSNNGSWSGESEDHKEKVSKRPVWQEAILGVDNDKREKLRQRNKRKHQRQKERRAQALHEKCSGFLMCRKLEGLAQQLVAMGFPRESATEALIKNEGKLVESVSWLFEGGGEADKYKESAVGGANLKIDISEELARIASLEIRYKFTKQEVKRAIVAAEGNLEQAEEALKTSNQDPPALPKPKETHHPPNSGKLAVNSTQSLARTQQPIPIPPAQPRYEKDFNYTKAATAVLGPSESATKRYQQLNRIPPTMELEKSQQKAMPSEKQWPDAGGANPSVSYSVATTIQTSPLTKIEHGYALVGSDSKNSQPSVREPVIMMQRAQSINARQVPAASVSSSLPGSAAKWYPSDIMKSYGLKPRAPSSRSLSPNNLSTRSQMFHQLIHQQEQYYTASNVGDSSGTGHENGLGSRTGASSTIAAASSLGLFSAMGSASSSGETSPVDWSTGGSAAQLHYTHIDWSLVPSSGTSIPSGLSMGVSSLKSTYMYHPNSNRFSEQVMKSLSNGVPIPRLHDSGAAATGVSAAVSCEWTSPFEGKDLFSLPRQFISSPSI